MSGVNLDDIDAVIAAFRQARAVLELLEIVSGEPEPKHDIVGTGLLQDACDAADGLLRHDQEAFKRMEARRIEAAHPRRS